MLTALPFAAAPHAAAPAAPPTPSYPPLAVIEGSAVGELAAGTVLAVQAANEIGGSNYTRVIRGQMTFRHRVSEADYAALLAFYAANAGGEFLVTVPGESAALRAVFTGPVTTGRLLLGAWRDVSVPLAAVETA